MNARSTDHSLAIASEEFVWADEGIPEAHAYLMPPTIKALHDAKSRVILDLGCGNGACTNALAEAGFWPVGCDSSESGLAVAKQTYPIIRFFAQDIAAELPQSHRGVYDAVVSLEVVEHLMQPRQLVDRAMEALRPGGIFLLSTPYHGYLKNLALALTNSFDTHWHPLRDFGHVKFFSKSTLCLLLNESGLRVNKTLRVGRVPVLACSLLAIARADISRLRR